MKNQTDCRSSSAQTRENRRAQKRLVLSYLRSAVIATPTVLEQISFSGGALRFPASFSLMSPKTEPARVWVHAGHEGKLGGEGAGWRELRCLPVPPLPAKVLQHGSGFIGLKDGCTVINEPTPVGIRIFEGLGIGVTAAEAVPQGIDPDADPFLPGQRDNSGRKNRIARLRNDHFHRRRRQPVEKGTAVLPARWAGSGVAPHSGAAAIGRIGARHRGRCCGRIGLIGHIGRPQTKDAGRRWGWPLHFRNAVAKMSFLQWAQKRTLWLGLAPALPPVLVPATEPRPGGSGLT